MENGVKMYVGCNVKDINVTTNFIIYKDKNQTFK